MTVKGDRQVNLYIADGIDYYWVIDGFIFDGAKILAKPNHDRQLLRSGPRLVRFQNNEFINNRYGGFFISALTSKS